MCAHGCVCTGVQNKMEQNQNVPSPFPPTHLPSKCLGLARAPLRLGFLGTPTRRWGTVDLVQHHALGVLQQLHLQGGRRKGVSTTRPTCGARKPHRPQRGGTGELTGRLSGVPRRCSKRAAFGRLHSRPPETTICRTHRAPHQTNSLRMVGSCVMTPGFPVVAGPAARTLRRCPSLHSLSSLRPPLSPPVHLWRYTKPTSKSLFTVVKRERQSASFERPASSTCFVFCFCRSHLVSDYCIRRPLHCC